jgi:hypothetical protein
MADRMVQVSMRPRIQTPVPPPPPQKLKKLIFGNKLTVCIYFMCFCLGTGTLGFKNNLLGKATDYSRYSRR